MPWKQETSDPCDCSVSIPAYHVLIETLVKYGGSGKLDAHMVWRFARNECTLGLLTKPAPAAQAPDKFSLDRKPFSWSERFEDRSSHAFVFDWSFIKSGRSSHIVLLTTRQQIADTGIVAKC